MCNYTMPQNKDTENKYINDFRQEIQKGEEKRKVKEKEKEKRHKQQCHNE